tara:strand:- start:1802 stop:2059 length:258 start_codon:yes stop_codon:yes gene_type:complete
MSDTSNKNDWSDREIGALWKRDNGSQKYLTGKLKDKDGNEQQVVIFSNKHKNKDTQPDFRVYKSEPRNQETAAAGGAAAEQEDLL